LSGANDLRVPCPGLSVTDTEAAQIAPESGTLETKGVNQEGGGETLTIPWIIGSAVLGVLAELAIRRGEHPYVLSSPSTGRSPGAAGGP
jgi:hypothetical protein